MAKHVVLVPGFIGFDALGSLRYYAGVTEYFRSGGFASRGGIHYFDNFPTASVAQRAERLRKFLAKKWLRGEFQPGDELTLIGHSTGGLDIRRLLRDLRHGPHDKHASKHTGPVDTYVDGCTQPVRPGELRRLIRRIVFLSVPHFGCNVADYFHKLATPIRAGAAAAIDGIRANRALPEFLAELVPSATGNSKCDLFAAIADTLRETDDTSPTLRKADEREARYQLLLWLDHMSHDLSSLADLRSVKAKAAPNLESPAFYGVQERRDELSEFETPADLPPSGAMPPIDVMSFATRISRPGRGGLSAAVEHWAAMAVASVAQLIGPSVHALRYLPGSSIVRNLGGGAVSLGVFARFGWHPEALFWSLHAICGDANLPFTRPSEIAPGGFQPLRNGSAFDSLQDLEVADNDGVVNTLSMLWPYDPTRPVAYAHYLVEADHADVIGHFDRLRESKPAVGGRQYAAYDILQSGSRFGPAEFKAIWERIFQFAL